MCEKCVIESEGVLIRKKLFNNKQLIFEYYHTSEVIKVSIGNKGSSFFDINNAITLVSIKGNNLKEIAYELWKWARDDSEVMHYLIIDISDLISKLEYDKAKLKVKEAILRAIRNVYEHKISKEIREMEELVRIIYTDKGNNENKDKVGI